MKTVFTTSKGGTIEFESKPANGGFLTRSSFNQEWAFAKDINPKIGAPTRKMNEAIWHLKLRKTYLERGWKLVEGTVLIDVDARYNTFEVQETQTLTK